MCKADSLRHAAVKLGGKGQRHKKAEGKRPEPLRKAGGNAFFPALQAGQVAKEAGAAKYHIINGKIPCIAPLENAKEHAAGNQGQFGRGILGMVFPLAVSFLFHPGIQKPQHRQHKENIYHVRMEVPLQEGIGWELMDGFIRGRRVMANIAGGIREPIALPGKEGQDNPINHVMHISSQRNGNARKQPGAESKEVLFFPGREGLALGWRLGRRLFLWVAVRNCGGSAAGAIRNFGMLGSAASAKRGLGGIMVGIFFAYAAKTAFPKVVLRHLADKGKGQGKCHACYQRAHKVVSSGNLRPRQFCQEYRIVLPAIVVVDRGKAVPDISGGQGIAAHHGSHKAKVHKFFFPKGLWPEPGGIGPQQESQEQEGFFPEHQPAFAAGEYAAAGALLPVSQGKICRNAQEGNCKTGRRGEGQKP